LNIRRIASDSTSACCGVGPMITATERFVRASSAP
jgi:hypothetical protein